MSGVPLTADQLDAVDASKRHLDACVVAGPGSGKTTVLVEYFLRLVDAGVDPLRILAITFTEKAAANMRRKLREKFDPDSGRRGALERAWVSTVHGFCARLLRENAVFAGIDPQFHVADEREAWRLQQESIGQAMEDLFREQRTALRALIRGLSSIEFEEAVLSAYDAMRGAGVGVEALARFAVPAGPGTGEIAATLALLRREPLTQWNYQQKEHLAHAMDAARGIVEAHGPGEALALVEAFSCSLTKCKRGNAAYELLRQMKKQIEEARYSLITAYYEPQRRLLLEIIERFDRIYRQRKRHEGALDFADLEEYAVRLLDDDPEARARVRAQFDHILMDEFQDTNGQQAKLLRLVRPPDRFYAVGDINQSIFGFRHAEPGGFRDYRDEVERSGRHLVELTDNFRSRPEILSAVETVLDGEPGIEPRALNAGKRFDPPRPIAVELIVAAQPDAEARHVARRILDLKSEFEFRQMAVLVRNTEVLAGFTAVFDQAGIPYVVNRGRGFYEAREVVDLMHLLRAIANPRDEISLAAVLRSPLVGVSDEALLQLKLARENLGGALMGLASAAEDFEPDDLLRLTRFRERLRRWRVRRESVSFDRLLLEAMDDCGYSCENGARGQANVDKFLAQARDASGRMSLDAFLDELSQVRAATPREPDAPPEDTADTVKLMTVHSAKGLEFPVVFVAALHKGIETDPPVVAFSKKFGIGARWKNPAGRKEKDDLVQHAIRAERNVREAEESNRLLYVAMTRAEHHLVLSFSGTRPKNWAAIVAGKLGVDPDIPREEEVACRAPDGEPWTLRLLVTGGMPELPARQELVESVREVEWTAPPELSGQQDANVTVTGLARFAACPRKYYLGTYLGFEGKVRNAGERASGPDASQIGTEVHQLLADTPVADPAPESQRLAQVFRESALGRRAAKAARAEREFDFLMAVESMVVRGQIDLWFEEDGGLVIVDYKTDAVNGQEAHQRAQDYAQQVRLYAMALERMTGKVPKEAWLHFLKPNTAVAVDLAPSLLDAPEQIVLDLQAAQQSLDFPLLEGTHCRRCEFFRDLCPAAS
jgi:ATP-dependent helicase/nuclease subunit A